MSGRRSVAVVASLTGTVELVWTVPARPCSVTQKRGFARVHEKPGAEEGVQAGGLGHPPAPVWLDGNAPHGANGLMRSQALQRFEAQRFDGQR